MDRSGKLWFVDEMKQYQTRNKIHEQKRSEERIQKIVWIFFHLAFCLWELQSISMCIFSCSWFSTAATALEIRTVFSAIAVFQSTAIQFNGVYSKDTFENLSKSVKDSQCCLAVIFSSSSVSFILTMKYAIYLHVCVAHRFYLIELRLHKYVRTHDACTIHENLILASRRRKKTHMRHESVVICIPIGEKWSSKCSNILTPNMQNEKRGKHQDIATHPLFIQMSVHISFCCDQADTICTLTFHLKRKKIEKQKEPATPAKMSCQLLLFNAILQRTWKIRNSHAWKTITQAWCMYIVHSWNDDGLVFSLNGSISARSSCVYSAVCKQ